MNELTTVLFFIFGISGGMGGFFFCYEKIIQSTRDNFNNSIKLYERNDQWRSKTSHGLLKTH